MKNFSFFKTKFGIFQLQAPGNTDFVCARSFFGGRGNSWVLVPLKTTFLTEYTTSAQLWRAQICALILTKSCSVAHTRPAVEIAGGRLCRDPPAGPGAVRRVLGRRVAPAAAGGRRRRLRRRRAALACRRRAGGGAGEAVRARDVQAVAGLQQEARVSKGGVAGVVPRVIVAPGVAGAGHHAGQLACDAPLCVDVAVPVDFALAQISAGAGGGAGYAVEPGAELGTWGIFDFFQW